MNRLELMPLWDLYGGLLTETQRDICNLYFNLDLTVSEIAAERGVSRQAISDCMKTCRDQLVDFEAHCGALKQLERNAVQTRRLLAEVDGRIKRMGEAHPEISSELDEISACLKKEFAADGTPNDR